MASQGACVVVGGHACLPGGMHVCQGGMHACQGVCIVAEEVHGLWGACMVAGGSICGLGPWLRGGHMWLPGDMRVWLPGGAWLLGELRGCRGACVGNDEIRSMSRRYASYWNAFFLVGVYVIVKINQSMKSPRLTGTV